MKKYKFVTDISHLDKNKLAKEIDQIIKDGWGDFGLDYVKNHILTSEFVTLALLDEVVVGFASAREMIFLGQIIYYLEFTAIKPNHQGKKLSIKLNRLIFSKIFLKNLVKLKYKLTVVTITPNPRVLGEIIRSAAYVFPNPYGDNGEAPYDVWRSSNFVLESIGDPYNKFDRSNNVLQGFYDEAPNLVYDENNYPKDKDKIVNRFAQDNLKFSEKKGREFVIYAVYTPFDLIKRLFV